MDINKVKEIIALFEESNLQKMSLEVKEIKISLEKEGQSTSYVTPLTHMPTPATAVVEDFAVKNDGEAIKSPLVGNFYAAGSVGAKPFVEVGSQVKKGDTLCIIEAMKVMNEIKAERDGRITSIEVLNGDLVQFDDILMYME